MYAVIGVLAYTAAWGLVFTGLFVHMPAGLWFLAVTMCLLGALLAWGRDERCKTCDAPKPERRSKAFSMFD